ncbi:Putative Cytochrome P450 E-class, group IV [Podospora comata]|uniref:Cytochrome P450 E-class, group IV n=1 Tax=Podospora comata TaxID=48703 RepID=A0ABY6SA39_PODCO|nr:Putative Cytochrome P450 E-class, group IV [Podospora comata]
MAVALSSQVLESLLTPGHLVLLSVLFVVFSFIVDISRLPSCPDSLPRVGFGRGLVASVKNWVYYVSRYNDWIADGYEKYNKKGRAFVAPNSPSRPLEIVVPKSQTAWMLEQPDRVLSTKEAHRDSLFNDYQFGVDDQFPIRTIHKHLARNIVNLLPGIQKEVHASIDDVYGTDTENWRTLNIWNSLIGIVSRVTNRMLVGDPLCHNEEFLKNQVAFADAVVRNGLIMNFFPKVFHPIVGPIVTITNRRAWRKTYEIGKPVIEQRLRDMGRIDSGADVQVPEDMLTWLIRQAKAEGAAEELSPVMLSKRLLPVEFAAIHTTVLTASNVLLDLASSDPSLGYIDAIRKETSQALREGNGHWTKDSLANLHLTDSAIKESMRVSYFARCLTHRKVIAPEGVTNPTEGWHAPEGSFLTLDLAGVHLDPEAFPEPEKYDAFRFVKLREQLDPKNPEEAMKIKRLGMVTTSPEHLTFSHGRHACPGRFFVAHELKMILAYLLNNYDIKHIEKRPQNDWVGATVIPPMAATLEAKRRKI